MRTVKRMVYRLGFRPKPGTRLFSPSNALWYNLKAHQVRQGFERGMRQMEERYPDLPSAGDILRDALPKDCQSFFCKYMGDHKHGHDCDFNCTCEKGESFDGSIG